MSLDLSTVPDDLLSAVLAVSDALSAIVDRHPDAPPLGEYVDADLLAVLAAAATLADAAKAVAPHATAEWHRRYPEPGASIGSARNGTIKTVPTYVKSEHHDVEAAFMAIACRVYGRSTDDGLQPIGPDELPAQARALLTGIGDVLASDAKLLIGGAPNSPRPGLKGQGLDPATFITKTKTPTGSTVTYTPPKE